MVKQMKNKGNYSKIFLLFKKKSCADPGEILLIISAVSNQM